MGCRLPTRDRPWCVGKDERGVGGSTERQQVRANVPSTRQRATSWQEFAQFYRHISRQLDRGVRCWARCCWPSSRVGARLWHSMEGRLQHA